MARGLIVHMSSFAGIYECEDCPFVWQGPHEDRSANRFSANAMRAHMFEHQRYGHKVPRAIFRRLDACERWEREPT